MEYPWAMEEPRALRDYATPYVDEIQSDFLRHDIHANSYQSISERIDTIHAQLLQSTMMSCEIYGGNHSRYHCTFNSNSGWQNHQNFTWYDNEGPAYSTEPLYPFYPPQESHNPPSRFQEQYHGQGHE